MIKQNIERIIRFVSLYKMNNKEYSLFKNLDNRLDKYIEYYQIGNKDAFKSKKILI